MGEGGGTGSSDLAGEPSETAIRTTGLLAGGEVCPERLDQENGPNDALSSVPCVLAANQLSVRWEAVRTLQSHFPLVLGHARGLT